MRAITKETRIPPAYLVSVLLILLVALALRVPSLAESLWFDELWSTRIKLKSFSLLVWSALGDVHPPGYEVLSFLWIRIFGDSELSVRMLPFISGLGGIVLTCEIARRYISPRAGLLAGILVALSPAHIWYSHEARAYALLSFLVLLAVWARSFLICGDGRSRWLVLYAAAIWAALSMHYYIMAFAGSFMVIDLLAGDPARRRLLLVDVIGCGAVFCYVGTKYLLGYLDVNAFHVRAFDVLSLWMTLFGWFPSGHALFPVQPYNLHWSRLDNPLLIASHFLLLGLLVYGMLSGWRHCRSDGRWPDLVEWLAPFLCVPILLCLLSILGFVSFIERSLFVTLPFFFILVATGLDAIRPKPVRLIAGVALFALIGSGLFAFFQKDNEWTVYKPKPNWRGASEYLLTNAPEGHSAVFVASPADVLRYYGTEFRLNITEPEPRPSGQGEIPVYYFNEAKAWEEQRGGNRNDYVFLVHNLFWSLNYERKSAHFLATHRAEFLDRYQTKGLRIEKYRLGNATTGMATGAHRAPRS